MGEAAYRSFQLDMPSRRPSRRWRPARPSTPGRNAGLASHACILLLAVSAALALTSIGCNREPEAVTFMAGGEPNEVAFWERLLDDFQRQSGIRVRLIRQPADSDQRRQELVVPLSSARPDPDVFLMDVVWVAQLAASGWLEPLEPYVAEQGYSLEPFFEGVVEMADRYEGTLYALPVYIDGGLLYYRTDLLEKYALPGPPETWGQLLEYSLKVQRGERPSNPSFYGFVWQGAQYEGLVCDFFEFAASAPEWPEDTRPAEGLPTEAAVRALSFMRDLIQIHGVSPPSTYTEMREEQSRILFQAGNALFERNWPYAWTLHQADDSPVRGKVGIARLPYFEGGRSVSTLGGWHMGMSRSSDRKSEAWRFMTYVASYEVQKALALNLGWNPARPVVYTDKEVEQAIPHLKLLEGIFDNAVSRPRVPYYSQASDVIQRNVNACLAGRVSEHEAVRAINQELAALARRYASER